jgi:hypothetical protein
MCIVSRQIFEEECTMYASNEHSSSKEEHVERFNPDLIPVPIFWRITIYRMKIWGYENR